MKRKVPIALALMVALPLAGAMHGSQQGSPPPGPFVRGVALGLFASDPDWDYGPLVREIRARGATDVLVVVNGYQSDRFAADVALDPVRSPTRATIARMLGQVRAAGMHAALMPVVRLSRRAEGDWRGVITPADGPAAWFAAYQGFVLPLADLAQQAGAQRFVVGSELGSMEPFEMRWRDLIRDVRLRYRGRLLYSANWDRASAVPFWDALDEVGQTAYFPLQNRAQDAPSSALLQRAWREPRQTIAALSARVGKHIVITEVGYPSQAGAADRPWDETASSGPDLPLQARLYQAFCDAFAQTPEVSGFYVWNWFGFGGPRDAGFTPRGKPASHALSECFARTWPAQPQEGTDG